MAPHPFFWFFLSHTNNRITLFNQRSPWSTEVGVSQRHNLTYRRTLRLAKRNESVQIGETKIHFKSSWKSSYIVWQSNIPEWSYLFKNCTKNIVIPSTLFSSSYSLVSWFAHLSALCSNIQNNTDVFVPKAKQLPYLISWNRAFKIILVLKELTTSCISFQVSSKF